MRRSTFTEDQIIGILKEHEAGVSVADLCRKPGVSDATVYKWKAKYGGMDVSEAKRCFKCVLCGNSPAVDPNCKLYVDHIIPFSRGGKTVDVNLRALCADYNIGRGNRFDD